VVSHSHEQVASFTWIWAEKTKFDEYVFNRLGIQYERGSPSSSELELQPIVHSHIPEPSARGNSVSFEDQGEREKAMLKGPLHLHGFFGYVLRSGQD